MSKLGICMSKKWPVLYSKLTLNGQFFWTDSIYADRAKILRNYYLILLSSSWTDGVGMSFFEIIFSCFFLGDTCNAATIVWYFLLLLPVWLSIAKLFLQFNVSVFRSLSTLNSTLTRKRIIVNLKYLKTFATFFYFDRFCLVPTVQYCIIRFITTSFIYSMLSFWCSMFKALKNSDILDPPLDTFFRQ